VSVVAGLVVSVVAGLVVSVVAGLVVSVVAGLVVAVVDTVVDVGGLDLPERPTTRPVARAATTTTAMIAITMVFGRGPRGGGPGGGS
jgi:hypothetical protein